MRATIERSIDARVPADGRTRKRFGAMRRAQEVALDLFERRGYGAVTIEEVAAAADLGPATLYRNFGTKERLVLWDDYDPRLFDAIGRRLPGEAARAVLDGLVEALGPIYARDRPRLLRRSRMALDIPEVRAASAADLALLRDGLAELFLRTRTLRSPLEAHVHAAAYVGALEVAITHWVRLNGETGLATLVRRAFAALPGAPV